MLPSGQSLAGTLLILKSQFKQSILWVVMGPLAPAPLDRAVAVHRSAWDDTYIGDISTSFEIVATATFIKEEARTMCMKIERTIAITIIFITFLRACDLLPTKC